MNLGLGLLAADSYFKEGDARKTRDYTQAKRDAELSTLDEQTNANRSGYKLRDVENQSAITLAPAKTANALTQQKLDASALANNVANQPATLETQTLNTQAGLEKAKLDRSLAAYKAGDIPKALARLKAQGQIDDQGVKTHLYAKVHDLLATGGGDDQEIVNLIKAQGELMGQTVPIASYSRVKDPKGVEYMIIKDASGKQIGQPKALREFADAKKSLSAGDVKTVKPGETIGLMQGGKFEPAYTAPESEASQRAKQGPLERDVGYLTSAHGMSKDQALAHLNSAKTMSREQFILKSAQDSMTTTGEKPDQQTMDNFGALYDSATGAGANRPSTPGSAGANNWNEWAQ